LVVRLESNHCPADRDEIAESYILGTLRTEQADAFEDHYVVCNLCATVLEKTSEYLDAVRLAAKTLRNGTGRAASGSSTY
jgi:anti-sigma-K factor RskA